jgi:rhodanese-related sulfurtransferase
MNTTKNLNNVSLLAFGFVALVVTINLFTTNNYGRANTEVVQLLQDNDYIINYHQLKSIAMGETDSYVLIDLRSEDDYHAGHIPTAINVPFDQLLEKSSLKLMDNQVPVLYADSESKSHAARMLLIASGFDEEIKVMGGDYEKAFENVIKDFKPGFSNYKDEKARFDFKRFMNTQEPSAKTAKPSGIIPTVKVETTGAQGGC